MYDKETLNRIVEILRDERRTLEEVANLEEKRCHLLTDNYWPRMGELDEEVSVLIEKLYALEKERLYAGSRMMHTQNADTLGELIRFVSEEDREELVQLQHDMTAVIQRLQFLKSVTEALLKDKKEMVDVTMSAARGESGVTEYTDKGSTREVNTGASSILFSRRI
ncbi:MAG TPA: flagellar export chaperone FlgN [Spirochaetota bacterium]|nr:flagellar export chaperone FlgN [Spirochaetota bacterium]HPH02232.1 flagellar export chaperone FlgN [Spirochaetota bacterium]HPN82358.1 flagellar export chaperone FlgN [Spirochaetota bacterium]